jgi:co-chaperonin GroES (HSP10)
MKIKNVGEDRYFIKPDVEKNTKTKSGIIVETSDDVRSYKTGVIIHIGLGRNDDKSKLISEFSEGDLVMYEPRNQIEIMIDDEKLIVVRESNIICSYTK